MEKLYPEPNGTWIRFFYPPDIPGLLVLEEILQMIILYLQKWIDTQTVEMITT